MDHHRLILFRDRKVPSGVARWLNFRLGGFSAVWRVENFECSTKGLARNGRREGVIVIIQRSVWKSHVWRVGFNSIEVNNPVLASCSQVLYSVDSIRYLVHNFEGSTPGPM